MKNTKAKIMTTAFGSLLLSTTFLTSAVLADEPTWGPDRQTYTMASPADHVVFNSITGKDAPFSSDTEDGDERKFIRIADLTSGVCSAADLAALQAEGTKNTDLLDVDEKAVTIKYDKCVIEFKQSVDIEPNKQYMVFIYYHNNASSDLNATGEGLARNVKLFSSYPELISGTRGDVEAKISYNAFMDPDNTEPQSIWAKAYFNNKTNKEIALRYVVGSAKHYNVGYKDAEGKIHPSDTAAFKQQEQFVVTKGVYATGEDGVKKGIFNKEEGQLLGFGDEEWCDNNGNCDSFGLGSGIVFGCEPYRGFVTYVLQSSEMVGTISKEVSVDGGETYGETATANPGDTLRYRVTIKNTGAVELSNSIFYDSLPEGLSAVAGSYKMTVGNSGTWDTLSATSDKQMFKLNSIPAGTTIQIIYDVKIDEDIDVDCTGSVFTNIAHLVYDSVSIEGTTKTDDAKVTIKKSDEDDECKPKEYNVNLKKEVSVDEGKKYDSKALVAPGATLRYKVTLKNTGTSDIESVDFIDKLPKGLTLVKGSVKMNVEGQEKWTELKDTLAYTLTNLTAGQSIYIVYDVKVGDDFDCDGSELSNKAEISYIGESKEGTFKESIVKVIAKKVDGCAPVEKLPETGPMEITMLSVIVVGIVGGSIYLILAKRELKRLTANATGEMVVDNNAADSMVDDKNDKTDGGALNA